MSLRYLGKLITQVRRSTDNLDGSSVTGNGGVGISDDEIIQYFNDGQDRVQSLADAEFSDIFTKIGTIPIVGGQTSYDLPVDTYAAGRISLLEFRKTSNSDYFPIPIVNYELQSIDSSGSFGSLPIGYLIRGELITVIPTPQSNGGNLRVTYPGIVDRLDIRRAKVTSTTDNGTDYSTILLEDDANLDNTTITNGVDEFLCAVTKDGVMQYRNVEYTAYDVSNRVITLSSGFALADGAIATGDYITIGRDAITNSTLPRFTERYLLTYAEWKLLIRRSSKDVGAKLTELGAIEKDLSETFRQQTHDVRRLPIINSVWT